MAEKNTKRGGLGLGLGALLGEEAQKRGQEPQTLPINRVEPRERPGLPKGRRLWCPKCRSRSALRRRRRGRQCAAGGRAAPRPTRRADRSQHRRRSRPARRTRRSRRSRRQGRPARRSGTWKHRACRCVSRCRALSRRSRRRGLSSSSGIWTQARTGLSPPRR